MTEEISGVIFGVWFLIGAALVFWMQAVKRGRLFLTHTYKCAILPTIVIKTI